MIESYFVLGRDLNPDNCAIYENPGEMENRHYPARGIRMEDSYPDGYKFSMSKDMPGIRVPDIINNALGYLMISAKLKELLEKHATAEIEYLRFTLLNHKRRVASDQYFIANLIGTVDCVDRERTIGDMSALNPGQYSRIKRLFLQEDKLDPALNLFRIASLPKVILIRDDLKKELEGQGITGAIYCEMGSKLVIN
jgi:hypothetical protein